jgi:hypothetical protein
LHHQHGKSTTEGTVRGKQSEHCLQHASMAIEGAVHVKQTENCPLRWYTNGFVENEASEFSGKY